MRRNLIRKSFLLVGADIAFVVTNYTICQYGALLYGALHMKVLVYIQFGKNVCSFCPPWMGHPQYLDQKNQLISSIQFFSLLKWAHNFPFQCNKFSKE